MHHRRGICRVTAEPSSIGGHQTPFSTLLHWPLTTIWSFTSICFSFGPLLHISIFSHWPAQFHSTVKKLCSICFTYKNTMFKIFMRIFCEIYAVTKIEKTIRSFTSICFSFIFCYMFPFSHIDQHNFIPLLRNYAVSVSVSLRYLCRFLWNLCSDKK